MKIKRNIYIMYAIALLQGMVFYAPIAALYRQMSGLTLAQIAVIESVFFIFSLIMEFPWGFLADRIGYRKTMIFCCSLYFLSKVIFWRADGFGDFLLERLLLGVVVAGLSGVDSSILYLSCQAENSQNVFGYYNAFRTVGLLFSAWFYTTFIGTNYRMAAWMTMISYGAAALFSLGIIEVYDREMSQKNSIQQFFFMFRKTLKDRRFLIFLVGYALYSEGIQMVTVWLNQNQYLKCSMLETDIGWAYIVTSVISLISIFSKRLTDAAGILRFPILVFFAAMVMNVVLAFTYSPYISFGCIVILTAADSLLRPLISELLNHHVAANNRATQLSIFAVLQDLVAAGANLAYGRIADISLSVAFLLIAGACVAGGIAFLICYWKPVRRK